MKVLLLAIIVVLLAFIIVLALTGCQGPQYPYQPRPEPTPYPVSPLM